MTLCLLTVALYCLLLFYCCYIAGDSGLGWVLCLRLWLHCYAICRVYIGYGRRPYVLGLLVLGLGVVSVGGWLLVV